MTKVVFTKKLLIFFSAAFFIFNSQLSSAQAEFSFEQKTKKFPKTPAGEILSFDYKFVNSGNLPLIITDIKVNCPCTKFTFPKEPILPEQKGVITVTFDTKSKIGYQDRMLEIYSNAKISPFEIRFKGMVDHKNPIR